MIAQAKRIFSLLINVKKLIFFFVAWYLLKETQNTSLFLLTHVIKNNHECLGELEKSCGNTRLQSVLPQHFLFSETFTCVSI